jgi:2-oxoglutarate ferredoxin oxidoreductase subunit gamma
MIKKKKKIKRNTQYAERRTKPVRCEEIFCAGFGGQGIMFMGKLLAHAGLLAGRQVTWMPSYGAEVRGGTAYSMVKISDGEIASPIATNPAVLVVMNKPSLVKYESRLKEGGILISNKSLAGNPSRRKGTALVNIPMTKIAHQIGDVRCANMIAIGALTKRSKMISLKHVLAALETALKNKEEAFAKNKKALEKGYKW